MAKSTEKSSQSPAKKSASGRKSSATASSKGKRSQPVVRSRKLKVSAATPKETDLIRRVAQSKTKTNSSVGEFGPGDTVGVYVKVREGDKERVQLYKGVCIKVQGKGTTRSFTVRKISAGVGVERTFPFRSPSLDRVEVIAHGKVRRAKLYFLRDLKGKAARLINTMVGAAEEPQTSASAAGSEAVADSGSSEA